MESNMNDFITLYGLNIHNDGYLDSVHHEYTAFRFSKTDEDTIITLHLPVSVADKLLNNDDFGDGYERYNFVFDYIVR